MHYSTPMKGHVENIRFIQCLLHQYILITFRNKLVIDNEITVSGKLAGQMQK